MWDLRIFDIFQIFIFSIISFALSMYISDNFKLSNNLFIKILQKLVFINSILALFGFIFYLLDISIFSTLFCEGDSDNEYSNSGNTSELAEPSIGSANNNKNEEEGLKDIARITTNRDNTNVEYYNFKLKKEIVDNIVEKGKNLAVGVVTDIAPNLGIGAAVGKVAAEAFKHTGGMAPAPRVAIVGTTALATAAGTKIGIELGKALMQNKNKVDEINSSLPASGDLRSAAPSPSLSQESFSKDGRNSPSDFDNGFIHSVLEEIEIPLITMVNGLCYLNYIEFSLILSLFLLLFRKYLISWLASACLRFPELVVGSQPPSKALPTKIIGFILSLKNKNKEVKSNTLDSKTTTSIEVSVGSLNKSLNTLDKYSDFLIVFVFLCLFWIKFINIYYSSNLAGDIDSFVNVYNHIKNQSFGFLLFSLKNEKVVKKR